MWYEKFCKFWRKGGNWLVFFIFWFIASAVISALEHSEQNKGLTEEQENKQSVATLTQFLKGKKETFENDTALANQLEKIIDIMDESPEMPRLFGLTDFELAIVKHNLIKSAVDVVKDEFARVKENLDEGDMSGRDLATRLIKLLSQNETVVAFQQSAEHHMQEAYEKDKEREAQCKERKEKGYSCEVHWSYGHSLHFTSTVFTTVGYGATTPITAGGKAVIILLIIFQIPFFLHCLATTASHINSFLDNILGDYNKPEDMETLTMDTVNPREKQIVILKGFLVLLGALFVHMLLSSIYHYCTTNIGFTNVLYFEFVRCSTVGFGDILPEDDLTLAGAIFKNILISIPSQIITFAVFVRTLPIIS